MKALTLTQPWATLIALGEKRYETRGWTTNHRGPLAIHASKTSASALEACEPFRSALAGARPLPLGAVVAVVDVVDVYRTNDLPPTVLADVDADGGREGAFGDWNPHRFAWKLANIRPLEIPLPARGSLGLWDIFGVCRNCGCTDLAACDEGCSWAVGDLCSACDTAAVPA